MLRICKWQCIQTTGRSRRLSFRSSWLTQRGTRDQHSNSSPAVSAIRAVSQCKITPRSVRDDATQQSNYKIALNLTHRCSSSVIKWKESDAYHVASIWGMQARVTTCAIMEIGYRQRLGTKQPKTRFLPSDAMHNAVLVIVNMSVCLSVRCLSHSCTRFDLWSWFLHHVTTRGSSFLAPNFVSTFQRHDLQIQGQMQVW